MSPTFYLRLSVLNFALHVSEGLICRLISFLELSRIGVSSSSRGKGISR